MKIVVMNHADVRVEVLDIPNTMLNENVEQFLTEHGYSLSNISWMAAPIDYVPVQFHNFSISEDDGKEVPYFQDRSARCSYANSLLSELSRSVAERSSDNRESVGDRPCKTKKKGDCAVSPGLANFALLCTNN